MIWCWNPGNVTEELKADALRIAELLHRYKTWFAHCECEVVIRRHLGDLTKVFPQECGPVIHTNYYLSFLCANYLCCVYICRLFNNILKILETAYKCASIALLQKAKAPIWSKLCVTYQQERYGDRLMESCQNSPCQVLQKKVNCKRLYVIPCITMYLQDNVVLVLS